MKKLIMLLAGIILLATVVAMMFLTGAIYDTTQRQHIDVYWFQPNNLATRRMGVPASQVDFGTNNMLEYMLGRYLREYFYVAPGAVDDKRRQQALLAMSCSNRNIYNQWVHDELPVIQKLADNKQLRLARLKSFSRADGADYWEVVYELLTWPMPNDLTLAPVVTRGRMFVRMRYEPGFRDDSDVVRRLKRGEDLATLLRFCVTDLEMQ